MKTNKEIIVENINKNRVYLDNYNVNKVRTQADSLIKQMKEKLNNCYNDTIDKLDEMDRYCQTKYSKDNNRISSKYF